MAHHGTQEPYLLKHNYTPVRREHETEDEFRDRVKCQLPLVHWRLDEPRVIFKSNTIGSFTEANVGAAQNMLLSVGTKTHTDTASRSPNFLGRHYQDLLAEPQKIQQLKNREARDGEVYEVVGVEQRAFIYGERQQRHHSSYASSDIS